MKTELDLNSNKKSLGHLRPAGIMQIFGWPEEETASNRRAFPNGQSNFALHFEILGKTELRGLCPPACGGCCHLWGSAPLRLYLLAEHQGRRRSAFFCAGCFDLCLYVATARVMQSLSQEIKAFSRNNLRKQCTRVTTLTGKRIIETWKNARIHVVEEIEPSSGGSCGYVQDLSLDLQVGVIKPWLLLGEYIRFATKSLSPFNLITFSFNPLMCKGLYYQVSCRKVQMFPFSDVS